MIIDLLVISLEYFLLILKEIGYGMFSFLVLVT